MSSIQIVQENEEARIERACCNSVIHTRNLFNWHVIKLASYGALGIYAMYTTEAARMLCLTHGAG
jgi:hypothetical protein